MIEFGYPTALWTGLAVGLPIFAHLAYQKISEKFSFSTLRFIDSSSLPRTGRRQPSDWLLLLLRIILFLLITFLLADPYWRSPQSESPVHAGQPERLLLIDTSPSMYGWNAWDQLQDSIVARIKDEPEAKFGLLFPQEQSITECPLGSSIDELTATTKSAQIQSHSHGLQAMMDRVLELFSPLASSRRVIILSDFQKSSWQEIEGFLRSNDIELELIPLGHGSMPWSHRTGNKAIIESKAAPAGSGKIRVWSLIKNWDDNRSLTKVSITAGGEIREIVEVEIPPAGSAQVQFLLPAEDFSQAVVRIEDEDSYSLDNNQSLWLLPPPPRTFGFWSQSPGNQEISLEQKYLQTAIESIGQGDWDRWELNQESADGLRMNSELAAPDFLIIPGLSGWFREEGLAKVLEMYLLQGGTALITPSSESHIQLNQSLKDSGLLNASFGPINLAKPGIDPYRFGLIPEKSTLNEVFFGIAARDLYLTQILQYCSTKAGEGLQVPLVERSGEPLFLVRSFAGGGRLCFSTFRILPQWTDLPMRNSFLPLLVELCLLNPSNEFSGSASRIQAGESWESSHSSFQGGQPGLFQVNGHRLEVVHPFSESMPEVMDQAELMDALLGQGLHHASEVAENLFLDRSEPVPLWHWFAIAVALFFLLEMILSSPPSSFPRSQEVPGA